MPRKFPANRIKQHRVYTVWEVAEALGCHRQTVIRWIKDKGLETNRTSRPWLIRGEDLKRFLGHRAKQDRCRLMLHQLYCLGCKAPEEPAGKMADYTHNTALTGNLQALCPTCGALMNKVIRRADLEAIRARIDVTIKQAAPRLMSLTDTREDVTFEEEAKTNAKAQL